MSQTQKLAIDTLAYIEKIVYNLNETESHIEALYNIRKDTKEFIGKNNLSLLEIAELGKNQLFYLNILRNYNWINAKDLAKTIKEDYRTVARHLNALENKGYLKSSFFEEIKYYKIKEK